MKKALLILLLLAFAVGVGAGARRLIAGTAENSRGFLIGGSELTDVNGGAVPNNGGAAFDGDEPLGWVSMNSLGCDTDGNGFVDSGACGGNNTSTAVVNYGVNIPSGDGDLSGYAWAGNARDALSFNVADLAGCPVAPCRAYREGNAIKGWARFIGVKNDRSASNTDWEGWVSLTNPGGGGAAYGVTVTGNTLAGYGWSGREVAGSSVAEYGWIDFSRVTITVAPPVQQLVLCPPGPLAINSGDTINERAYFGPAGYNCSNAASTAGVTDVTNLVNWRSNDPAIVNDSLANTAGTKGRFTGGLTAGGTSIFVDPYSGVSATPVQVTVTSPTCTPSCDAVWGACDCAGRQTRNCTLSTCLPSIETQSCVVPDSCRDFNLIEIGQ